MIFHNSGSNTQHQAFLRIINLDATFQRPGRTDSEISTNSVKRRKAWCWVLLEAWQPDSPFWGWGVCRMSGVCGRWADSEDDISCSWLKYPIINLDATFQRPGRTDSEISTNSVKRRNDLLQYLRLINIGIHILKSICYAATSPTHLNQSEISSGPRCCCIAYGFENMDAYIYQSQILKQIAAVDGRVSKTNRNSGPRISLTHLQRIPQRGPSPNCG
jgi:hypothetical protein